MHAEVKSQYYVFSSIIYLYFIVLRQNLLLNPEFPFQLDWLISKPPEFVPLPGAEVTDIHHCAKPLCGYLGPKVRFSKLLRKHFILEVISPAPREKILRYMFGNIVWSFKESLCINSALAKVSQLLSPTHMDGTTGRAQACKQVYQWLRQILLEKLGRK